MTGSKEEPVEKVRQANQALRQGDYESGIKLANDALNNDFNNAMALFQMGYGFLKAEKYGLAYQMFLRSAQLQPDRAEPWNNAGMCHQETWNLDDAERCFRKAMQLEPDNQASLSNLALIYINRCQPLEALKWIAKAEKAGKEPNWQSQDNKALALLMLKRWKEGWATYRSTAGYHKQRQLRAYNNPEEPMWNGEPGTVVVYGNQGLGDEIAFASCIPDAMQKADVIIDCDHRLAGLFKRSFPQAKVYGTRHAEQRDWDHAVDYSIPSDCLPSLFRNSEEEFPGTPYLRADPERRLQWRALFDTFRKPVIGIAWNGGIKSTGSVKRSLTLEDYLPIFKSIDATWVCLEYRPVKDQLVEFQRQHGVQILDYPRATRTTDYDDAAGLVAELDLVISVTTSVIHLAGALGKEVWCLAPSKPRWFYGLEGNPPFYKSLKMFRQTQEWPIKEVVKLLQLRWGK
jgi:Tfp pilus assembly protein PilF